MIRAVTFDFGGVLMRTGDYAGRRKWERRLGLGERGADELVFASPAGTRAQLGEVTDEEIWRAAGERYGLDAEEIAEFRRDFWSGDFIDRELVGLIRRLRARYKLGLLSNAWDTLRPLLARQGLAPLFDVVVISCEEGLMKPDPEIFRRLLARLDVAPGEAVFVDDMPANVDGARAAGMHALRFTSTADVEAGLRELGVDAPC